MKKSEQIKILQGLVGKYPNGDIKIAGTQHPEQMEQIGKAKENDALLFVRVFGNPYDANAIDVRNTENIMIGHFTEEDCAVLAPVLEAGQIEVTGRIARIITIDEQPEGADRPIVYINIAWEKENEV